MGQKVIRVCLGLEVGDEIDSKWAQGTYWSDGNILKLGCSDNYTVL